MEGKIAEVKLSYRTKVSPGERVKILSSQDAHRSARNCWDEDELEHVEEFKVLLLNRSNSVLGLASISKGGISCTVIDLKVIFQYALRANASSLILVHNHPSGNLKPSEADITITKKAQDAARFLDMQILDHIILVNGDGYFSFCDEGLL